MKTRFLNSTIVALSTPPGTGAIGVIRMSGPRAFEVLGYMCNTKKKFAGKFPQLHIKKIKGPDQNLLDEAVVSLFQAPNSYTGEDIVEISCHGSPYIISQMIQLCLQFGCIVAGPGEFTQRAFINGKMDLSQAEAVADLIASENKAAHDIAIRHLKGGVKDEISLLREKFLDFASLLELELDFSEEDVEFADRKQFLELIITIEQQLTKLIQSFRLGNAIKEGIQTVIVGRPNAGKSTLLNALLNEDRAIVSEIAGTTRDTIEEKLNINGVHFKLIDTAGLREAQDAIEAIGVERSRQKIQQSALIIYVFDINTLSAKEVQKDIREIIPSDSMGIIIANKVDIKPDFDQIDIHIHGVDRDYILACSAKNKVNIEKLKNLLYDLAVGDELYQGQTIISNMRHIQSFRSCLSSLNTIKEGLAQGLETDLLAQEVRVALMYLGEISGQVTNDEVLGNIFGKFCIGK